MPSYVTIMKMSDIPICGIDLRNYPPKEYYKNFRDTILQAKTANKEINSKIE